VKRVNRELFGIRDAAPERTRAERQTHESELDAVYRAHAADISRFLRRIWGQSDTADTADLLHEVFLVAQRRWSEFRGSASARTWLYAIALRVVVARRRKRRLRRLLFWEGSEESAPDPLSEHVATPERLLQRDEATRQVHGVLEKLSERDRSLILLFELEGMPASAIAEVVGTSENAVWVGLHRARARFRTAFVELYGGGDVSHD
jgi:RNA polymerase sigma-70 factor, ECF subfamily